MFRRIHSLPALLVFVFALAGGEAAVAGPAPGNTLVGVWEVSIYPFASLCEFPSGELGDPAAVDITVVNRDGTMSNSDSLFGTGHGLWRRVANMEHELKLKVPVAARPLLGIPEGIMLTLDTDLTLRAGGTEACGLFAGTFVPAHPLFGDFFAGTVVFKRVTLNGAE